MEQQMVTVAQDAREQIGKLSSRELVRLLSIIDHNRSPQSVAVIEELLRERVRDSMFFER